MLNILDNLRIRYFGCVLFCNKLAVSLLCGHAPYRSHLNIDQNVFTGRKLQLLLNKGDTVYRKYLSFSWRHIDNPCRENKIVSMICLILLSTLLWICMGRIHNCNSPYKICHSNLYLTLSSLMYTTCTCSGRIFPINFWRISNHKSIYIIGNCHFQFWII